MSQLFKIQLCNKFLTKENVNIVNLNVYFAFFRKYTHNISSIVAYKRKYWSLLVYLMYDKGFFGVSFLSEKN